MKRLWLVNEMYMAVIQKGVGIYHKDTLRIRKTPSSRDANNASCFPGEHCSQ